MTKVTVMAPNGNIFILKYTREQAQEHMDKKSWKKFVDRRKVIIRKKDSTEIWEVC